MLCEAVVANQIKSPRPGTPSTVACSRDVYLSNKFFGMPLAKCAMWVPALVKWSIAGLTNSKVGQGRRFRFICGP